MHDAKELVQSIKDVRSMPAYLEYQEKCKRKLVALGLSLRWGWTSLAHSQKSMGSRKYVIIMHFNKQAEAEAVQSITTQQTISFISKNIFTCFDIPKVIITNNVMQFTNFTFKEFCRKWDINLRFSSAYHPQINGMTEVTNRTILQGLKKILDQAKGRWLEEWPHILWAYRTTSRTATGEIPFSLVYRVEVVIPVEVQVSSFRTQHPYSSGDPEEMQFNLNQAEYLRKKALIKMVVYTNKMSQIFNSLVKP